MSGWMTPLSQIERALTTRIRELTPLLPVGDPQASVWDAYVETAIALERIMDRLRPLTVAGLPTTIKTLRKPQRSSTGTTSESA